MTGPERVLVYSKYAGDLDAFRRVLASQLPEVPCAFASSLEGAKPYLEDAEILYGWGFPSDMLRAMPKLEWVQKMGAGVDDIICAWPLDRPVVLTRTDGALIAARMAEYVVAAILDKSLRMDHARRLQQERKWSDYTVGSIRDLTIGVAGLGEIGSEIARTLRILGARVIGWRRSPTDCHAVDKVYVGTATLEDFVTQCDALVLVLPLTSHTAGIFGSGVLAALRPNVHLVNVGRGGVIDEAALAHGLESGRIGHATLDVFEVEPLPPTHPFWTSPRVTMTPHVCGPLVPKDVVPHFVANYRAFRAGDPLRNVIDMNRQY